MTPIHRLRVLKLAKRNVREVAKPIRATRNFGDLHNQMARAAISVVSNIAEAAGATTDPGRKRRMADARGSNYELQVQLELLVVEDHPLADRVDHVGRMLTRLIQRLE